MKTLFRLLFMTVLLGSRILAQEDKPHASAIVPDPAMTETELSPEAKLMKVKSLYKQGEVSYSEVLTAEAELLQVKLASETQSEDTQMRLQKIYKEQIRLAQARGDREDSLKYHIKLLEVSAHTENREALLGYYKQLVDYKKEKYNEGIGTYIDVLLAEISYLKATLPGQSPEQAKQIEEEILQKQNMLKQISEACSTDTPDKGAIIHTPLPQ